jgi:hypothetical protein
MDKIIRPSGHRRLPVGGAFQQSQSDDARVGQHAPQPGDGLKAGPVQADQNYLWLQVLSLGQDLLASTDRADDGRFVVPLQEIGCSVLESSVVVHRQDRTSTYTLH